GRPSLMATKPTLAQPNGLHRKFELSSTGRLGPVGYTASPAKGVGDGSLYCRILLTAFTSTGPGSLASLSAAAMSFVSGDGKLPNRGASHVGYSRSQIQMVVAMLRLDKFKRYPLTFGPTPIEHLPRMTAALGGKVQIYAKRDDCNSGLAMGGNKLRKLEYIVPDAIASNADTLVSIGGVQSNHTRMVAATAAKIGMKCVVIQESWVPHEDAVYDRVGNILMTRLMGAESRIVSDGFDIGIRKSWEDAIQSVKDAGGNPYPIPAGASVHKYGGLGYVGFAEEV